MLTTPSPVSFCHHIFGPLYLFLPATPFPLGTTGPIKGHCFAHSPALVICLVFLLAHSTCLRLCVFVFLFICCFWFDIPHMSEIIWLSTFSVWLVSVGVVFSRSIRVAPNGGVSCCLGAEEHPCTCAPTTASLSSLHPRTHRGQGCSEHRGACVFMSKCFQNVQADTQKKGFRSYGNSVYKDTSLCAPH